MVNLSPVSSHHHWFPIKPIYVIVNTYLPHLLVTTGDSGDMLENTAAILSPVIKVK